MIREEQDMTREQAVALVEFGMKTTEKTHPEVFDTEPHWAICAAVAHAFEARGWKPYNRFNDLGGKRADMTAEESAEMQKHADEILADYRRTASDAIAARIMADVKEGLRSVGATFGDA
jgi:hypothetical protein